MRRRLSGIQIGVRVALLAVFALLLYGTVTVFFILDSTSHSASDTLRPLFLSIGPVWLVAIWAARIALRTR
jgi:hypothetical protein